MAPSDRRISPAASRDFEIATHGSSRVLDSGEHVRTRSTALMPSKA